MFRKFNRSIYWRGVMENNEQGEGVVIGGHNLLWNDKESKWDLTNPPLYPTAKWKEGASPDVDWNYPVPRSLLL